MRSMPTTSLVMECRGLLKARWKYLERRRTTTQTWIMMQNKEGRWKYYEECRQAWLWNDAEYIKTDDLKAKASSTEWMVL